MISCERTECPWWDEDGCLSSDCGEWEEGAYMNKPEEEEDENSNAWRAKDE